MGDFINNKQLEALPEKVRQGVHLHRRIDSYTDQHPEVLQGKKRLYAQHGKYAPVLVDIFYDYFLAKSWNLYSIEPLRDFVSKTYLLLEENKHVFPERLQKQLPHMIHDDWLCGYAHYEGLETTFHYLKRRVSKPDLLNGSVNSLKETEELFHLEFNTFFPDLQAEVTRQLQEKANPQNERQS